MLNDKPSLFLVAGNRLLRETLAKLLSKRGDFAVCGVSPFVPGIARLIGSSGTDVLILDSVTAALSNGVLIADVLNQFPDVKIVLIDMDGDPEIFLDCVRTGVLGYFVEDASAAEVISGIHAVAGGRAVCSPQLLLILFTAFSMQWTALPNARIKLQLGLTRRQQQLIPLISQGLTNKEIAARLNLSEGTVKNHIHEIMRRVGATDRLRIVGRTRLYVAFR